MLYVTWSVSALNVTMLGAGFKITRIMIISFCATSFKIQYNSVAALLLGAKTLHAKIIWEGAAKASS